MYTLMDLERPDSSSHDEISRPPFRWWSRAVIPAAVLVASLVLLLASAWDAVVPSTVVRTEAAVGKVVNEQAPGQSQVQAAGWLEPAPYMRHVSALAGGVLKEVLVLEGKAVKRGQVVARMIDDDAKLEVARVQAELALKKAVVAEAKARSVAAQRNWENPIELKRRASVSNAQETEAFAELNAAKARVTEVRVRLEQAQRDAKRANELVKSQYISNQEAETARNRVLLSEASLSAALRSEERAAAKVERTKIEKASASEALRLRIGDQRELDAAAAGLRRAEAEVEMASAKLAEANLRLSRMQVVSPIDGIVVSRFKEPGDKVMLSGDQKRSSTILSVYDPKKMQARVDVPLADAAKISIGQHCEVISEVLPSKRFTGRVDRILHVADIQKNTLEVKVILDNPSSELRPEMLCRVRFLAKPLKKGVASVTAVFAPKSAVKDGKLWLLRDFSGRYGRATSMPAMVTQEQDGWVAIETLNVGDLVITTPGPFNEGQRVKVEAEP